MVKDKQFYKTLLIIAIPVALQNLLSFAVNMLDTVMVGTLGDVTLSATSLANQVSIYMMMIVRGLGGGAAMMISQYWGKQDIGRIKSIFSIGMKASVAISLLATVLIMVIPETMMGIFTNDPLIIAEGVKYLVIVAFSFVIYAVSQTLVAMLRCVEIVRIGLTTSIAAFAVSIR